LSDLVIYTHVPQMDPKIMLQGRLLPEVTTSSEIVHMEETRGANLYFNMCCVTLNNFDKTQHSKLLTHSQHSSSLLCCRMHELSDKHCQFKPVDILIPRIPGHCSLPVCQTCSQQAKYGTTAREGSLICVSLAHDVSSSLKITLLHVTEPSMSARRIQSEQRCRKTLLCWL